MAEIKLYVFPLPVPRKEHPPPPFEFPSPGSPQVRKKKPLFSNLFCTWECGVKADLSTPQEKKGKSE